MTANLIAELESLARWHDSMAESARERRNSYSSSHRSLDGKPVLETIRIEVSNHASASKGIRQAIDALSAQQAGEGKERPPDPIAVPTTGVATFQTCGKADCASTIVAIPTTDAGAGCSPGILDNCAALKSAPSPAPVGEEEIVDIVRRAIWFGWRSDTWGTMSAETRNRAASGYTRAIIARLRSGEG